MASCDKPGRLVRATVAGALLALSPAHAGDQNIQGPPPHAERPKPPQPANRPVNGIASFKLGGHQDWTSSGLEVKTGELVKVRAWGRIRIAALGGRLVDPNGAADSSLPKLMASAAPNQLIAVIGDDNNEYIAVGKDAEFRASRAGTLYFTLNQLNTDGNDGDIDIRVQLGTASGLTFGQPSSIGLGLPGDSPPPVASTSPDGSKTIEVSPKLDWTNTYINVTRGDIIVIQASGAVSLDLAGHVCGPDGTSIKDPGKLIPEKPTGALIAVIGVDNNDFVFVGASGRFVATRSGLLFLGINEEDLTNNSGALSAKVRVEKAPK